MYAIKLLLISFYIIHMHTDYCILISLNEPVSNGQIIRWLLLQLLAESFLAMSFFSMQNLFASAENPLLGHSLRKISV